MILAVKMSVESKCDTNINSSKYIKVGESETNGAKDFTVIIKGKQRENRMKSLAVIGIFITMAYAILLVAPAIKKIFSAYV